jgi:ArsR family transcriptional regulator
MTDLLRVLAALADESRLRILNLVTGAGELCVCDIERVLGYSQTKVSRHLTLLKNAGLLKARRQGAWMLYSYSGDLPEPHQRLVTELSGSFRLYPLFHLDLQRLRESIQSGCCATAGVIAADQGKPVTRHDANQGRVKLPFQPVIALPLKTNPTSNR